MLEPLFRSLSAKDRSILGHTFGVYDYEKLSADELGLQEMLSQDGVTKAKKAALKHLRQKYQGSDLHRWRAAFSLVNRARSEAEDDGYYVHTPGGRKLQLPD